MRTARSNRWLTFLPILGFIALVVGIVVLSIIASNDAKPASKAATAPTKIMFTGKVDSTNGQLSVDITNNCDKEGMHSLTASGFMPDASYKIEIASDDHSYTTEWHGYTDTSGTIAGIQLSCGGFPLGDYYLLATDEHAFFIRMTFTSVPAGK